MLTEIFFISLTWAVVVLVLVISIVIAIYCYYNNDNYNHNRRVFLEAENENLRKMVAMYENFAPTDLKIALKEVSEER